jgi:hypothetical protein
MRSSLSSIKGRSAWRDASPVDARKAVKLRHPALVLPGGARVKKVNSARMSTPGLLQI